MSGAADGIHPLWLSFADPALEARFAADYTAANLFHFRLCHWLTIGFFGFFTALGALTHLAEARTMLLIGFGVVVPLFVAGLIFSFTRAYRQHWPLVHAGYVVITGWSALAMTATTPAADRYYVLTGLIFCFLFGYAVIRLRFVHASISGAVLTGSFLGVVGELFGGGSHGVAFASFYVVGVNLLGMVIAYGLELNYRRAYRARLQLERQREGIAKINAGLEQRVRERTRELEQRNRALETEIARGQQLASENLQLERQVLQAQRLESVGRLAGGVAHDFNNLLTVINNYAQFVAEDLDEAHPSRDDLNAIIEAGERAARLTGQLLAFSRQQMLKLESLDLNEVVAGIEPMLQRLLGEDISLQLVLESELGSISADRGQLEQVIMNLAVNARDAMPLGGQLILATRRLEHAPASGDRDQDPRGFVVLEVTDTGTGIDEESRANLFEPFFSTKEQGKGTGLGLATVYGIVKQLGGEISVDSQPGDGATFRVVLPQGDAQPAAPAEAPPLPTELTGTERVMLVEDERGVRQLAQRVLAAAGYAVHVAEDGATAVELHRRVGPVDLLLTDVVMPGLSGHQLAERLTVAGDSTPVLYMSGYTDDAIAQHGVLEPGTQLLNKPFSARELLTCVRAVLDAAQRSR